MSDAQASAADHVAPRDIVADALRRAMQDVLSRNARTLTAAVLDGLRRWIDTDATPDALAEWLTRGGWGKVDADAVEAALVTAARAPQPIESVVLHVGGPSYRLLPGVRRADSSTPEVLALLARDNWQQALRRMLRLPPDVDLGDSPPALLGLDALKCCLERRDWSLLAQCLSDRAGRAGDWLGRLAVPWMEERRAELEERLARHAGAVAISIRAANTIRTGTGSDYVRLPTALQDAAAWCGAMVPFDGDVYAHEPSIVAAPVVRSAEGDVELRAPRAWAVAPAYRIRAGAPRQLVLPGVLVDPPHHPDLAAYVAVAAVGAAVHDHLPGLAAKLLPLLFALCPLDGTAVHGTLRDLARLLYPDWRTRRRMAPTRDDPGDVRRVGAAVAALLPLRVVTVTPGSGVSFYPVLHCDRLDAPTSAGDDPEVCLRLNPSLAAFAVPRRGSADYLLVNLSRLMRLDARRPHKIATAMRLYAYWHAYKHRTADGRRVLLTDRLPFLPVDQLLVEVNYPGPVADVLAGANKGRAGKVRLAEARSRMVDDVLPYLDDAGIVGRYDVRKPDRHAGRGAGAWEVRVLPPADYLEAITTPPHHPPKNAK